NQYREVKGTITDKNGEVLPGVSVKVKGTMIQTSTGNQGAYLIQVPSNENATLVFSFIGFSTQEVSVGAQQTVDVTLATSVSNLDEIVVVGYGTQRRSLVTSAIGSFKPQPEDIRQVASPSRLLEGRIPGVNISVASGNLGAAERISIRGASSISAGNEPLYVIDGIPINTSGASLFSFGENYSPLSVLNHADIE